MNYSRYQQNITRAILIFAVFGLFAFSQFSVGQSGTQYPFAEWAWGADSPTGDPITTENQGSVGGVGWIRMYDDGGNYGVVLNGNKLEGYAWSEHFGWLRFGGLSGFPVSQNTAGNAKMDLISGKVYGWARFCAGFQDQNACSGASRTDGFDGWVSLSGPEYGLTRNSSVEPIRGYAWAGDLGWIAFGMNGVIPPLVTRSCSSSIQPSVVVGREVEWTFEGADEDNNIVWSETFTNFDGADEPDPTQTPYSVEGERGKKAFVFYNVPGNYSVSVSGEDVDAIPFGPILCNQSVTPPDDGGDLDTVSLSVVPNTTEVRVFLGAQRLRNGQPLEKDPLDVITVPTGSSIQMSWNINEPFESSECHVEDTNGNSPSGLDLSTSPYLVQNLSESQSYKLLCEQTQVVDPVSGTVITPATSAEATLRVRVINTGETVEY